LEQVASDKVLPAVIVMLLIQVQFVVSVAAVATAQLADQEAHTLVMAAVMEATAALD
jgi:hypothetical protein